VKRYEVQERPNKIMLIVFHWVYVN